MPVLNEKSSTTKKKMDVYHVAKRIFDVFLSVLALIVLAIPMVIICIVIKLESPGPAFYVHNRIGKNGEPLPLLKFRTMCVNAEQMINDFSSDLAKEWKENYKLKDDPRITRFGKILRETSLDELPQLVNIIKGELSIVGPRPVVADELEKYGKCKEKFLSVTPGLTGYWQAYARSNCTYEKRMEMELFYVDHANFWWDIKIIFATVGAVIRKRGAM